MANNCWYEMVVTGPTESIERLYRIMNYEDPVFYIYRVFSVTEQWRKDCGGGYGAMCFGGEVAWSAYEWTHNVIKLEGHKFNEHSEHRLFCGLPFLSELLHLNIEIWTQEPGVGFQEHIAIIEGGVVSDQCANWYDWYFDDSVTDEEIIKELDEIPIMTDKDKDLIYDTWKKYGSVSFEFGGLVEETDVRMLINGRAKDWEESHEVTVK